MRSFIKNVKERKNVAGFFLRMYAQPCTYSLFFKPFTWHRWPMITVYTLPIKEGWGQKPRQRMSHPNRRDDLCLGFSLHPSYMTLPVKLLEWFCSRHSFLQIV